ncbi:MAG: hypothetical protein H6565_06590 [Lewinellaceae bacterium]|nr:hypothetical protein [Saprospiraceae bacterium]MCB9306246.1 hypothetical protein [Lewinellaceae bacterium]MCB9354915.1 hypothetical protein [Lewinellaceae bacterium]
MANAIDPIFVPLHKRCRFGNPFPKKAQKRRVAAILATFPPFYAQVHFQKRILIAPGLAFG